MGERPGEGYTAHIVTEHPTGSGRSSTLSLPADVRLPDAPGPVRTCVGCRARGARSDLLRVVVADDAADLLRVDHRRRLPGRGAWVHPRTACLDLAEKRRAFPRALRRPGPLDVSGVRSYLESTTTVTTDESGSNS